jgi:hypothetical protein
LLPRDSSALWPILHDDKDFVTAARCLPDVRERTTPDAQPLATAARVSADLAQVP